MTILTVPALALFTLISLVIYRFIIQPLFLSPLSQVPPIHWSSPITPLWILLHRKAQTDTPAIHAAHLKHGPIIRLAPNELSINTIEGGVRTIYSGGYDKGTWYYAFNNYGVEPMFAMSRHAEHAKRKRMLSNIYAKSTLQKSEALAKISHALLEERLLPRLKQIAREKQELEMYDVFGAFTLDFVTAYVFGLENGSDLIRDPAGAKKFLHDFKSRQPYIFWPQELPGLTAILSKIGLLGLVVPKWVLGSNDVFETWLVGMRGKAEHALVQTETEEMKPEDYPIVYAQLRNALLKEDQSTKKPDLDQPIEQVMQSFHLEIASELLDHVFAGFDTSSITLTYLAWELSLPQNKPWQTRLRTEIATLKGSVDPKEIDALPTLHAILMETLRLHAPIPGNQPRITPANATLSTPNITLSNLPANIRVQSQAWTLHRNAAVFPSPETWQPERWIDAEEAQAKEMGRWFWAFGSGGRMCVGSNLAMLSMKSVMVALWGKLETSVVDDGGMGHNGGYIAEPVGKGGKFLVLRLEEIEGA